MYVDIRIVAEGDPPPWEHMNDAIESPCLGFAILEKGTENDKTSCGILTKGADGRHVLVQFTGDMFITMAAALKGARERFGDPWSGA